LSQSSDPPFSNDLSWPGQRVEGDRVSFMAANTLPTLIDREEKGFVVTSCYDIPEARRWRILQGAQYFDRVNFRLDLIRSHDPESRLQVWKLIPIPVIPKESQQPEGLNVPDVVFGGDYVAFLEDGENGRYFRVCSDSFYFPIP